MLPGHACFSSRRSKGADNGRAMQLCRFRWSSRKVGGKVGDVFTARTQRRQTYIDDVDSVVEVLAKSAGGDFAFERAIGGANDAGLHGDIRAPPSARKLSILKELQQLGLETEADLIDAVKEERAATGEFGATGLAECAPVNAPFS